MCRKIETRYIQRRTESGTEARRWTQANYSSGRGEAAKAERGRQAEEARPKGANRDINGYREYTSHFPLSILCKRFLCRYKALESKDLETEIEGYRDGDTHAHIHIHMQRKDTIREDRLTQPQRFCSFFLTLAVLFSPRV